MRYRIEIIKGLVFPRLIKARSRPGVHVQHVINLVHLILIPSLGTAVCVCGQRDLLSLSL
jgi:hypothetical protein